MTELICQHCGACSDAAAAVDDDAAAPVFCKCGALPFCTPAHLLAHTASAAHTAEDCARMARQMARREWLLLPSALLPWSAKPPAQLCRLLAALGLHGAPAWRYACPVHGGCAPLPPSPPDLSAAWPSAAGPAAATNARAAWDVAWSPAAADGTGGAPAWRRLGGGGGDNDGSGSSAVACDWPSYYAAAGLSPASPAALLLHHALTLWHCLARVVPAHGGRKLPGGGGGSGGGEITVHYLGPRAGELGALPCFLAAALLLPRGTRLRLEMAGPGVPAAWHGRRVEWGGLPGGGGLRVTLWHGRYDAVVRGWRGARADSSPGDGNDGGGSDDSDARLRPHLIFAPNAGLPAFASWAPTLACALALGGGSGEDAGGAAAPPPPPPPVIATDYSEEAVHLSLAAVAAPTSPCADIARARRALRPELNPFRCPLPATSHGTALPACSNALLFGWL